MNPDVYIKQNGHHIELTVLTGEFKGVTARVPKEAGSEMILKAVEKAIKTYCGESANVGYDPWITGWIMMIDRLDQFSPVSPRNASA